MATLIAAFGDSSPSSVSASGLTLGDRACDGVQGCVATGASSGVAALLETGCCGSADKNIWGGRGSSSFSGGGDESKPAWRTAGFCHVALSDLEAAGLSSLPCAVWAAGTAISGTDWTDVNDLVDCTWTWLHMAGAAVKVAAGAGLLGGVMDLSPTIAVKPARGAEGKTSTDLTGVRDLSLATAVKGTAVARGPICTAPTGLRVPRGQGAGSWVLT